MVLVHSSVTPVLRAELQGTVRSTTTADGEVSSKEGTFHHVIIYVSNRDEMSSALDLILV